MIRGYAFGILAFFICFALSGCSIIRIEGAKSATVVKSGILKIEAADPNSAIAVNVTGFGVVPETRGATLGYSSSQIIFASPESHCKIFIFELPTSEAENKMWNQLIAANPSICTTNRGQ